MPTTATDRKWWGEAREFLVVPVISTFHPTSSSSCHQICIANITLQRLTDHYWRIRDTEQTRKWKNYISYTQNNNKLCNFGQGHFASLFLRRIRIIVRFCSLSNHLMTGEGRGRGVTRISRGGEEAEEGRVEDGWPLTSGYFGYPSLGKGNWGKTRSSSLLSKKEHYSFFRNHCTQFPSIL